MHWEQTLEDTAVAYCSGEQTADKNTGKGELQQCRDCFQHLLLYVSIDVVEELPRHGCQAEKVCIVGEEI